MLKKIPISAGNRAGRHRFSLIPVSRRVFAALLALCALLTLAPPGYAANSSLSMDKCPRSEAVYTPGDFAAARLAVYGILDDRFRTPQGETGQPIPRPDAVRLLWKAFDKSRKTETPPQSKKTDTVDYRQNRTGKEANASEVPFTDVLSDYADAIQWAFESDVARGVSVTEFGTYNTSRRAFVSMLLNAIGYRERFDPAAALDFADSIGLTPVGLSDSFTLGDAALYLQQAATLTVKDENGEKVAASELMNIPEHPTQEPFPATLSLTPHSVEDAEAQLRDAACRLAETVLINGERLTEDELFSFFSRYFMREDESWHTSLLQGDYAFDIDMETAPLERLSEWERMDYHVIQDSLRDD